MLDSTSSSTLFERFEAIKKSFSRHRRRRPRSSSISTSENNHEITHQMKLVKQHDDKYFYSSVEQAKCCMVTLESTYRENLEQNTTYLIGKSREGQMILFPKQLIEQVNGITMTDDLEQSDDETIEPLRKKGSFKSTKTPYTSQGNIVTCVTGSFN